jgi:hypothetical protein
MKRKWDYVYCVYILHRNRRRRNLLGKQTCICILYCVFHFIVVDGSNASKETLIVYIEWYNLVDREMVFLCAVKMIGIVTYALIYYFSVSNKERMNGEHCFMNTYLCMYILFLAFLFHFILWPWFYVLNWIDLLPLNK